MDETEHTRNYPLNGRIFGSYLEEYKATILCRVYINVPLGIQVPCLAVLSFPRSPVRKLRNHPPFQDRHHLPRLLFQNALSTSCRQKAHSTSTMHFLTVLVAAMATMVISAPIEAVKRADLTFLRNELVQYIRIWNTANANIQSAGTPALVASYTTEREIAQNAIEYYENVRRPP